MNNKENTEKKPLFSAKQKMFHIYSIIIFIGACLLFYILGGGTEVVEEDVTKEVEMSLPTIGSKVELAEDVFDATEKSSAFRLRKEKEDLIAGSAFDWYNNDTTSKDNSIISSTPISAYEISEEAKLQKTIQQSNDLAASFLNKKEEEKTSSKRSHCGSSSSSSHSSVSSADRAERQARYDQARERNEKALEEYRERMNASEKRKEEPKKVEEKKIYAEIDNGNTKKGFYSISSAENNINRDIRAVVHGEYKNISSGSQVKLRLLDNIRIGNVKIPKNTFIYALLSFGNGRAQLKTEQINYNGKMLPFEGIIYDRDGFMGLYIPDNTVSSTKKEAGAEVVSGVDLNISSPSSFVSSAINSVTGAVQSAVSGSIRDEKITISANYQLIIKQE